MNTIKSLLVISFAFILAVASPSLASGLPQCSSVFRPDFVKELQALQTASPQEIRSEDMDMVATKVINFYKDKRFEGRKILIFTDATWNQKSGVITVMKVMAQKIKEMTGLEVVYVTPTDFGRHFNLDKLGDWVSATGLKKLGSWMKEKSQGTHIAVPQEKEILAYIKQYNPAAIHLMVEGSVGFAAKAVLMDNGIPFTSAYHTDIPQYIIPQFKTFKAVSRWLMRLGYNILKGFHKDSHLIMSPSEKMSEILRDRGFDKDKIAKWSHGVEISRFDPKYYDAEVFQKTLDEKLAAGKIKTTTRRIEHPISLYVGRIAREKNLEDFLKMKTPGTKILIGPGDDMIPRLQAQYPEAVFLDKMPYEELPRFYASADLFVMTSLTETFGLVMLEAAASGTPVLAYNVQGPVDAISSPKAGVLVNYEKGKPDQNIRNLEEGFQRALELNRQEVREYAEEHPWEHSIVEFLYFLKPLLEPIR